MSRRLDEIPFTSVVADEVRATLKSLGISSDDAIVAVGCTGLTLRLREATPTAPITQTVAEASFVRKNMSGSGCGLPCYVPPDRFCLVHNTIGGLQPGQAIQHAAGIPFCSRMLTDAEELHARAAQALIEQEGLREAREHFGVELVADTGAGDVGDASDTGSESVRLLTPKFRCPEHAEFVWACRYCLAAAVIHGPFQPVVEVQARGTNNVAKTIEIEQLADVLASRVDLVEVYVRVKRWALKLVED